MSENNNSRQLTILTIAAVVMSVASLITAVAALYTLKYGNERDEARIARLAAVMEENAAKKTTTKPNRNKPQVRPRGRGRSPRKPGKPPSPPRNNCSTPLAPPPTPAPAR